MSDPNAVVDGSVGPTLGFQPLRGQGEAVTRLVREFVTDELP
jgi:hypothetical protein